LLRGAAKARSSRYFTGEFPEDLMQATIENVESMVLAAASKAAADGNYETPPFTASRDLFGGDSPLDSMDLVALVVDLEEQLRDQFGKDITLADERAMSQEVNPFSKVESLTRYIHLLLTER
jgi:acyl carrier protein